MWTCIIIWPAIFHLQAISVEVKGHRNQSLPWSITRHTPTKQSHICRWSAVYVRRAKHTDRQTAIKTTPALPTWPAHSKRQLYLELWSCTTQICFIMECVTVEKCYHRQQNAQYNPSVIAQQLSKNIGTLVSSAASASAHNEHTEITQLLLQQLILQLCYYYCHCHYQNH